MTVLIDLTRIPPGNPYETASVGTLVPGMPQPHTHSPKGAALEIS